MSSSTTSIAKNFGSGGLTPTGANANKLRTLLSELQGAVGDTGSSTRRLADAAAGTATAESTFYRARTAGRVTDVRITADLALAGDNTNNATITIRRRNADGSNAVVVATLTTNVANPLVAFLAKSFGALTNTTLAAGQLLTFQVTKTGTGAALPSMLLEADIAAVAA